MRKHWWDTGCITAVAHIDGAPAKTKQVYSLRVIYTASGTTATEYSNSSSLKLE